MSSRRQFALAALGSALAFAFHARAADAFPAKPVRVIVPFPPGGGADTLIRLMAPRLTELWGQPVVVENRPGASGHIGAAYVASQPGDGYTLMMGSTAALTDSNIVQFAPLALVSASSYVVTVHPAVPAKSIRELITYAKANPGALMFGSSGTGAASHLTAELFASLAGVQIKHVPYKGTGQALTDLLAGHVGLMFAPAQTVMPQVQAGKLRALAVTSGKRSEALPGLPTVAEAGLPGYEAVGWFGLFAPVATPAALVNRLNADFNKVLAGKDVQKAMAERGDDAPPAGSAEEFGRFVREDQAKWARLIRQLGIRQD